MKVVSGFTALCGTFYGLARSLVFGTEKSAQSLSELRSDPIKPVVTVLSNLCNIIGQPIVIYIDDLDRCTSDYVVELLEGIQTLLREHPFVYIIASDRQWICSSFEKVYADFGGSIGEPGRPLGYLFLDKVFQLTASLPQITDDREDGPQAIGSRPEA
jgi:hypothetical protein